MVCLQGITEDRLRNTLTSYNLQKFPLYNWLIFKLTEYIYSTYNGSTDAPQIPKIGQASNKYTEWFNDIKIELRSIFMDVTPERILQCCENPPSEEIALIIYNITSLEIQKGFYNSIPEINQIKTQSHLEEKCAANPADDDNNSTDDDMPALESQSLNNSTYDDGDDNNSTDDDMPALEPQTP